MPNYYFHDMLGKSDKHIAKTEAFPGLPGHNKFDYDYSLKKIKPDLLIANNYFPFSYHSAQKKYEIGSDYIFQPALFINKKFRTNYLDNIKPVIINRETVNSKLVVYSIENKSLTKTSLPLSVGSNIKKTSKDTFLLSTPNNKKKGYAFFRTGAAFSNSISISSSVKINKFKLPRKISIVLGDELNAHKMIEAELNIADKAVRITGGRELGIDELSKNLVISKSQIKITVTVNLKQKEIILLLDNEEICRTFFKGGLQGIRYVGVATQGKEIGFSRPIIQGVQDIFLLAPGKHLISPNKVFHNMYFEYRILGDQGSDGLILDWDEIKRRLKNDKEKIYFSDKSLKQQASINNFGINTIECNTRSLAGDIDRYPNHIFLLLYKNIKKVDQVAARDLPGQFSKALQGTGYRTIVIGTGKYSEFYKMNIDSSIVRFNQKKNSKIGSYKLPFKIDMVSTGTAVKPFQKCQLRINGNSFLEDNKSGLAVLVIDPEIGVVVDNFLYESLTEQEASCLYELSETPLSHKTQLLSSDDFVLTGTTKPELTDKESLSVIQFKGKNSVFGYRLTSDLPKKGVLVMYVLKRSGGLVRAGLQTKVPEYFRTKPALQMIYNSDDWQKIVIAFELFPETSFKEREWAFLGIWGSDADTQVQVKDMRIIWTQQDLSRDTSQ